MRRVLIVSPHFPPVNAPDMQRVRMSAAHYRAGGWEPVILCVGDAWQDGTREPELCRTIPDDVTIVRTRALPLRWTRLLGIGNLGLRCWFHFLFAGSRLIRRQSIDLVLFSNTQFITFTLGRIWRALHGVPYVFDMQDPWRTDHYSRPGASRPPGGWKYQLARFNAWMLEGWSFRHCAGILSVSPDYIADLRARYTTLAGVPSRVIRFGTSQEDLEFARAQPGAPWPVRHAANEVHFLYTGAAGPVMPEALTALFDGLRRYREQVPEKAARLKFHFYGTTYVAPGKGRDVVIPLARICGVDDMVDEISHRLGHLESLRLQQQADVLLLAGSSDLAYSPSKLYPYFLARRPMLALVFRGSVLADLVDELGGAGLVELGAGISAQEAQSRLGAFLDAALAGFPDGTISPRREEHFARHYLAPSLTAEQCNLFDLAMRPAARESTSANRPL